MARVEWQRAWQDALYGADGFYRDARGPAGHFTTATHGRTGAVLAGALVALAREHDLTRVVDVGAGRGELLAHLHAVAPDLHLTGVDVVDAGEVQAGLPPGCGWVRSTGGAALPEDLTGLDDALVVAHEWLDVVPCVVAQVDDDGVLRHVEVDGATGSEALGQPVGGDDLAWAREHWPTTTPGDRVEVGLARDRAWSTLLSRLHHGVAVAVDYAHRAGERPAGGTLAAYREGRTVTPVPDGSCDLTAHVAMDTLDHDELLDQRTALRGLGVDGSTPPHDLALREPQAYLRALELSSAAAALTAPGGFGDFLWAVKRVG
ncbi:SAM-dependent methyltransferase [Pedococcus ginsenosidimutans]|uniref:SAM-dependent methyltransferase n=1 Tax=Pedococcus ginsenosidimutans TaxID=490570 RepID=A0ABP8XPH2_9MICO